MAAVKEFSVQERLVSICKLQRIDSKIGEIKKLRGELPMEVKDLEDEIAQKREALVKALEKRMEQRTSSSTLFTIRWNVI